MKLMLRSIILKLIIIILVFTGFTISYLSDGRGTNTLLFFTIQSNLWLGIVDIILLIASIIAIKRKEYTLKNGYYILQQVFTLCIALTGVVFIFILLPGILLHRDLTSYNPFTSYSIIFHAVVPALGIIDYFISIERVEFKKYSFLFGAIPSLYYFIFSLIGYICNWDFGEGRNYPYFFLNYASPAHIFGFSSQMPYLMGSFYWIILLLALVLGMSYLLIYLLKRKNIKRRVEYGK